MIKVKQFVFSMFGVNTYLVIDEDTRQAAVIDPAMYDAQEQAEFDAYVREHGITVTQIINTHLHLDHCFGENYVRNTYGVPVKANIGDAFMGQNMDAQYRKFGLRGNGNKVDIDVQLKDGDIINIGNSQLQVIQVPGHSPGGIALYNAEAKLLFSGDSLFRGSIGRTDLEGGNAAQLVSNVKQKLLTLPEDTVVLPGHDKFTTIGNEKMHNPYLI